MWPCCACSSFAMAASSTVVTPKRSANCKRTNAIFGSSPAAGVAGAAGTAGAAGAAGATGATSVACAMGVAVCAPAVVAAADEACRAALGGVALGDVVFGDVVLGGVVGGAASAAATAAKLSLLRCLDTAAGRREGESPPPPPPLYGDSRRSYVDVPPQSVWPRSAPRLCTGALERPWPGLSNEFLRVSSSSSWVRVGVGVRARGRAGAGARVGVKGVKGAGAGAGVSVVAWGESWGRSRQRGVRTKSGARAPSR